MKKIILVICSLVLLVLTASALWATNPGDPPQIPNTLDPSETSLAIDLSVEEMVNQSDLILIGQCTDVRSQWIDRNLVTLATVSAREILKGDGSSSVTVVLPGGVDANRKIPIAMTYPGAPRITPSEDVFLFLTQDDEFTGGYGIVGFAQGKFSIVKDEDGQEVVSRDLTRVALRGKAGVRRGTVNTTSLSSLKAQITDYIRKR
jgi:hypothetical protein